MQAETIAAFVQAAHPLNTFSHTEPEMNTVSNASILLGPSLTSSSSNSYKIPANALENTLIRRSILPILAVSILQDQASFLGTPASIPPLVSPIGIFVPPNPHLD